MEDATEWSSFILENQTPGYTTTERTERVLSDILEDDPFRSVDTKSVYDRTMQQIASNRSKNPRLSKFLHAGDDLDAVAFVPKQVERMKRDEYTSVLDPNKGYGDFLHQLTQNLKGEINKIWYVDRYATWATQRKRLGKVSMHLNKNLVSIKFGVLTAYDPYSKGDREQSKYLEENERRSPTLYILWRIIISPHIIDISYSQTNKETRWWVLPDGFGFRYVKSQNLQ